jgi:hypothetical protein
MTDWKEKIEAQIAKLQNSKYLLDENCNSASVSDCAASLQALLDIVVAAEKSDRWLDLFFCLYDADIGYDIIAERFPKCAEAFNLYMEEMSRQYAAQQLLEDENGTLE